MTATASRATAAPPAAFRRWPRRACVVLALLATSVATAASAAEPELFGQRAAYRAALAHLAAGRSRSFQEAKSQLGDYALYPYLEYHELESRIEIASDAEMGRFRDTYADLPVTRLLFRRWLKLSGKRREWRRFLAHYEPGSDSTTTLRCYHLRALYGTGRREEALARVPELWVAGKSQPKACDPLFETWRKGGRLTQDLVWERLRLALRANQQRLAGYLLGFFDAQHRPWAQALYDVHRDPRRVTRAERFATDSARSRAVLRHGLKRLAREDPRAADAAWRGYRRSHAFSDAARAEVEDAIRIAMAGEGVFPDPRPEAPAEEVAKAVARAAILRQNWPEVRYWIERLPAEALAAQRWRYWHARAGAAMRPDSPHSRAAYEALARERSYYGFLAAQRIGAEVRLNNAAGQPDPAGMERLRNVAAVNRALELYAVGDRVNARREWNRILPDLDAEERIHAVYLVVRSGWTAQGIRLANRARLRDRLDFRFPLVHHAEFRRVDHTTTVPHSFLIAIARQESLFDARGLSSAGAQGLMQLMPATAREVAKRAGLAVPSSEDLRIPAVNMEIAGYHLASLSARYGNSRPLVAAAYNAGASRLRRWIKDAGGTPMDVWIESIPFRETRNYVKNVLAFAVVYGQLMSEPVPLLYPHEMVVP